MKTILVVPPLKEFPVLEQKVHQIIATCDGAEGNGKRFISLAPGGAAPGNVIISKVLDAIDEINQITEHQCCIILVSYSRLDYAAMELLIQNAKSLKSVKFIRDGGHHIHAYWLSGEPGNPDNILMQEVFSPKSKAEIEGDND